VRGNRDSKYIKSVKNYSYETKKIQLSHKNGIYFRVFIAEWRREEPT
jgi:hypothetical protein